MCVQVGVMASSRSGIGSAADDVSRGAQRGVLGQRASLPPRGIGLREIAAEMAAATFPPVQGGHGDQQGDQRRVRDRPGGYRQRQQRSDGGRQAVVVAQHAGGAR